ncbi:TPA: helix-turn-helix domain-containing protein [Enterococcus faecium]
MKDGRLIKKLRKERGVTQTQLVEGIGSRSALARFEAGDTVINLDTLILYLDKLNIQPEEYFLMRKNFEKTTKKHFFDNFMIHIYEKNREEKNDYLSNLWSHYEETKDSFYIFLYIQVIGILAKMEDKEKQKDIKCLLDIVISYLDKVESWGYFELSMYTNLLFCFSHIYREQMYKKILSNFNKYQNSTMHQRCKHIFLINSIILALEDKKEEKALFFLQELHLSSNDPHDMFSRVSYFILRNILTRNVEKVHYSIQFLKELGYVGVVEQFEAILEKHL